MDNIQELEETQTNEIQVEKETREDMLSRHRKEITVLQNKEIALKKAAAKGSKAEQKAKKKQVEEQISQLTTELKEKLVAELASVGYTSTATSKEPKENNIDILAKAIAGFSVSNQLENLKPTKSAKRKEKRAQQEAAREQRIQEEQSNIVSDRMIESEKLEKKLELLGLVINEIKPDGHCLYRAVEDQLKIKSGGVWRDRRLDQVEMREMVDREIEKERFRLEVIKEERRRLEAEVIIMHNGGYPSSYVLAPPPYRFEPEVNLHGDQVFVPENRMVAMPVPERYGGGGSGGGGGGGGYRSEIRGFEVVPFQRRHQSPMINKITTYQPKETKNEIIGLGHPFGPPISSLKQKQPSQAGEGSNKRHSENSRKKIKEEWSCAVCEITATSEQGLNDHISGKKHQAKMAALKTNNNNNNGAEIGFGKTKNSHKASTSKRDSGDPKVDKKIERGDGKKQKFKFWCKMCQVGASDEKMMSKHREGKKHLKNASAKKTEITGAKDVRVKNRRSRTVEMMRGFVFILSRVV